MMTKEYRDYRDDLVSAFHDITGWRPVRER